MKRKKVALYDPYLDTLGGGERHILSMLKILNELGFHCDIFWHENLSDQISKKLNVTFQNPVHFINTWHTAKAIQRFQMLGQYDVFLYVTDGSYFFSSAKRNFVFSMVPQRSLYSMTSLNRLKTWNYSFIANSHYTQKRLQAWEVYSDVIYPYIDDSLIHAEIYEEKKPVILSVGRFFKHLHSKRQDIAIEWFKVLKKEHSAFKDYSLILAGSLKDEDMEYMKELQGLAEGRSDIIFKINIPFSELYQLYRQSRFYWHFAGYNVDEKANPERVEHLGITPIEAMSSGCITCAYQAGGPAEIIESGKTGILFRDQQQLFDAMLALREDYESQNNMRTTAKRYVVSHFSYDVFKARVKEVLVNR